MPTVNVDKEKLFNSLGKPSMTIAEFEDLCFDFGIELDDVTSEKTMASKEHGNEKVSSNLSDRVILKIDVSANRYDLLCEEGLSRALSVFKGKPSPNFVVKPGKETIFVQNTSCDLSIRPYIVGAILRDVTLDNFSYDSLIQLQEKLHLGICRRRTKVAIGTHDLDTIQGPFYYETRKPSDISFIPLNQTKKMNGNELITFYESDKRLSKFLHIIKDSPVFPLVSDHKKSTVLSLPPIINGDHSKIKVTTKNIFIECTATDLTKANTVLNMIVAMFSQYCKVPFTIEGVKVVYENSISTPFNEITKEISYPNLNKRLMKASIAYINSCVGLNLSATEIQQLLLKMELSCDIEGEFINVHVPPTRSDILHECDIMEDVAVAYGINKLKRSLPKTNTIAEACPINKFSDKIRREIALCGWIEVLPLTLCSNDENYAFLRKKDPLNEAVVLANPQTVEYEVVRTSLLPGILKTLHSNKSSPLPIQIFEVGDVVLQDKNVDRLARNERRLCCLYTNKQSGLELIHGLLDRLMLVLNITNYKLVPSSHPTFFEGRQTDIVYDGKVVGNMGILHPEVLNNYELLYPCSILEINLEPFL